MDHPSTEIDRLVYRNPLPPLGYQILNPPDIVRKPDPEEVKINFDEWIKLGIFEDEDVTIYDHFTLNTDSEVDDIDEVPFQPLEKNMELICLSDDEEIWPIPLDKIKKEKEEIWTEKETKVVENKEGNRIRSVVQRINKKPQDKAAEDVTVKKTDEFKEKISEKSEKHREKKAKKVDEGNRHKKLKAKIESDGDKSSQKKSRRSSRDDDSDSEVNSEERHRRKVKKYHSPSPPDDYYQEDYKSFKKEYDDDEDYYPVTSVKQEYPSVHGAYRCNICNLRLSSLVTYQSHMTGKRHKKNLDAKYVAQAVAKSYFPTTPTSKYPNPPPGFRRIESKSLAKIQEVIDDKLRIPCPGLNKVIEIQSLLETSYYCTLCDAPCSTNSILPHLSGFKHQLNCLKHYESKLFDEISYKHKYQIESIVTKKLKAAEKKYGRGCLKVEKEVPDDGTYDHAYFPSTSSIQDYSFKMPSTSSRDHPSTSRQGDDFLELYQSSSVPDPSKAGFYCRICLSHSNSKAMWEAHISGKRHLANLKKAPGTGPSKSRNIPAPAGTRAILHSQLRNVDEPIVGLDQIREIQRLDICSVTYTCFLCGGISVCEDEIVDHILLTKHRKKYLEKIQYPDLETLGNCELSEHALSSVIAEMCEVVEREQGRGEPEVYFAKNSLVKM